MSPEEFVNSRSARVDKAVLSSTFANAVRSMSCISVPGDYSLLNYEHLAETEKAALSIVRAAFADLFNKMNVEHFHGFPEAKQIAQKLYDKYISSFNFSPPEGFPNWLLCGEQTQDAWVEVAMLALTIWSQANSYLTEPISSSEAETSGNETEKPDGGWELLEEENKRLIHENNKLREALQKVKEIYSQPEPLNPEEARELRGNQYGHFHLNHEAVGLIWTGIISSWLDARLPIIPASLVETMMAGLKLWRMVRAPENTDSHVDCLNYAKMVEESQAIESGKEDDPTKFLTFMNKNARDKIDEIIKNNPDCGLNPSTNQIP